MNKRGGCWTGVFSAAMLALIAITLLWGTPGPTGTITRTALIFAGALVGVAVTVALLEARQAKRR